MIPTGIEGLDELLDGGYHPGSLIVISGGIASGKTTFLRHAIRSALAQNKTVWACDFEGSIAQEFKGCSRYFNRTNISMPEVLLAATQPDLVAYDNLQLHPIPRERDAQVGNMARWVTNFAKDLQQLTHPVKLVTWYTGLDKGFADSRVPKGLNFAADVSMALTREHSGDVHLKILKNRFGLGGVELLFKMPNLQPIIRKSLWERLDEDTLL